MSLRVSSIPVSTRKNLQAINVKIKSSKAFPVGVVEIIQDVVQRSKKMKTDIQDRRNIKTKFVDSDSVSN